MANNCLMTNRIRSIRRSQNITLDHLAEQTGLSTSYLSRMESGGRGGSLESFVKISRALRVPVADLTDEYQESDVLDRVAHLSQKTRQPTPHPKSDAGEVLPVLSPIKVPIDVPVFGTVAASGFEGGAFRLSSDIVEWAARPPGLMMVPDLYALEVRGDSMFPKFEPGDIIYVHPHRQYRPGDVVVIQEPDSDNGEPRSYVKVFRKETDAQLIASQYNPPTELEFAKSSGFKVHKVMTNRDLFGI